MVLLPAWEKLQAGMQHMRQCADESLEFYIARIQKIEADLSMVYDNSNRVRNSVTMKLLTSVTDDLSIAATMAKTELNSMILNASEEQGWMLVVFSRREEEQRKICATARVVEQGYVGLSYK